MSRGRYTVAVRELCEFAAKRGDLDLRFTPSPTAQQGIDGHKLVAARRGAAYRAEVALTGDYEELVVRGRADGYDTERQVLEEIKTVKVPRSAAAAVEDLAAGVPANHRALHWAQAKVYGWLLCQRFGLDALTVSVVYLDVHSQRETASAEQHSAAALKEFFDALCERFLGWARRELDHRQRRDAALADLRFPHASFRCGQRTLAENVFRAARLARCLLAQAPTGLGKTLGTIFPLLKACATQELDKLFFLTARASGKAQALAAIDTLRRSAPDMPLRVIELVARETSCEHPDKSCHGESCPLASGFYDRLPEARSAAVAQGASTPLSAHALRDLARMHTVCPYYLMQELVRWSDVVVADYNYFFDSNALLHRLTAANQWRVAVLVDEAHNLIDRARAMYSAELRQADFDAARASAPPAVKPSLDRLQRAWHTLSAPQTDAYQAYAELPQRFVSALQEALGALTEALQAEPAGVDSALLRFYFDALHFGRLVETFGGHSLFDVSIEPNAGSGMRTTATSVVCIRNLVPAPFLKPRFASTRTSVLFSATLAPHHFYADTLGLPDDTAWLDVASPFDPGQLKVHVVRGVSTRFIQRGASLAPIAELLATQYAAEPGNYLAYFSSFDYLEQAADAFELRFPQIPIWRQARRMAEADRATFLARFAPLGRGIGFAVLGGAFAEGIDLPGQRLIGAFIVTLGLPQVNPVNDEIKRRNDAAFGTGYDYTYLFPGLRKVVQAAGRVIRTPSDRGSVYLIDERFASPEVLRLLPAWWKLDDAGVQIRAETVTRPVLVLAAER